MATVSSGGSGKSAGGGSVGGTSDLKITVSDDRTGLGLGKGSNSTVRLAVLRPPVISTVPVWLVPGLSTTCNTRSHGVVTQAVVESDASLSEADNQTGASTVHGPASVPNPEFSIRTNCRGINRSVAATVNRTVSMEA